METLSVIPKKPTKSFLANFRMTNDTREMLGKLSELHGRSMAVVVEYLIQEEFKKYEQTQIGGNDDKRSNGN